MTTWTKCIHGTYFCCCTPCAVERYEAKGGSLGCNPHNPLCLCFLCSLDFVAFAACVRYVSIRKTGSTELTCSNLCGAPCDYADAMVNKNRITSAPEAATLVDQPRPIQF